MRKANSAALLDNLQGQIYLNWGENEKALDIFLPQSRHFSSTLPINLDVALAYAQEGNYEMAKRFYSDSNVMQHKFAGNHSIAQRDMPGTGNLRSLTASIHLARGIAIDIIEHTKQAERELEAAHKLAPKNALIAGYYGFALLENQKRTEALAAFKIAQTRPAYIAHAASLQR